MNPKPRGAPHLTVIPDPITETYPLVSSRVSCSDGFLVMHRAGEQLEGLAQRAGANGKVVKVLLEAKRVYLVKRLELTGKVNSLAPCLAQHGGLPILLSDLQEVLSDPKK